MSSSSSSSSPSNWWGFSSIYSSQGETRVAGSNSRSAAKDIQTQSVLLPSSSTSMTDRLWDVGRRSITLASDATSATWYSLFGQTDDPNGMAVTNSRDGPNKAWPSVWSTPSNSWLTGSNSNPMRSNTPSSQFSSRSRSSLMQPWTSMRRFSATSDLAYMINNPYNSIRGRDPQQSSMWAVRTLLGLVPLELQQQRKQAAGLQMIPEEEDEIVGMSPSTQGRLLQREETSSSLGSSWYETDHDGSNKGGNSRHLNRVSPSETASQLAEGTVRALRDLALDEAVELRSALRFWADRWEQPLLSWLEAGPFVWTSPGGYNHQLIGQKVSQIQAVLARRCAAIGELQQQLLMSGWQRGVAQWGVVGGSQWVPVAGFVDDASPNKQPQAKNEVTAHQRTMSSDIEDPPVPGGDNLPFRPMLHSASRIGLSDSGTASGFDTNVANVFVRKRDGGGIFVDDPGFLAEWSVNTMALVRQQLYRAGNGAVPIPYETNWRLEAADSDDSGYDHVVSEPDVMRRRRLPQWATDVKQSSERSVAADSPEDPLNPKQSTLLQQKQPSTAQTAIIDLPLMVAEVEELLDVMEHIMVMQRRRRLNKLKPTPFLMRNWYMMATFGPLTALSVNWMLSKGRGKEWIKFIVDRTSSFLRERVWAPCVAIFNELWKGRESFSDKKAREEAIDILKKMIRSWLDETFPQMPEAERIAMAEAMDVSLLEQTKEQSMKTFYEINNVVRMSFIEMQYMKKEMMNALHAMDEMMSANDINMNLAAITPVVMLGYALTRAFSFLYYVLLKLGKSREEVYASFREILTDIERLLVMRDNPPKTRELPSQQLSKPTSVLGPDDLGMLMLLIHECRSIMWRNRRYFSGAIIRSVSEDLAELAGERGAVSVQQQLRIVARMCRTYPFLKVISTGHMIQYTRLRMIEP